MRFSNSGDALIRMHLDEEGVLHPIPLDFGEAYVNCLHIGNLHS